MSELQALPSFDKLPEGVSRFDVAEAWIVANGGFVETSYSTPTVIPVTHRFTPGLYIREMRVPAGWIIVGKQYKREHPFVLSRGSMTDYSDPDGSRYIEAPYTGITRVGTKRIGYCHEDVVFTTFHVTDLTDVDAIEEEIIEKRQNPLLVPGGLDDILRGVST